MENMDDNYRHLFENISPSTVIVDQTERIDYFCIGSVILSDGDYTYILTQSKIISPSENLSVRFSDGLKQSAKVLAVSEYNLCILVTGFYPKAKEVQFFDGDLDHSYAAAIAPASKLSVYNLPGFIVQRSLKSCYRVDGSPVPDSDDYFIFKCRYGDKSPSCVSRLVSGPVFHLNAEVIGVVIYDLQYKFTPPKIPGESRTYPEGFCIEMGFFLKVVMRVSKLRKILRSMAGDDDWQNGLKKMASDCHSQ